MCTKKSSNDSDVSFEDRDVNVGIEVSPALGDQVVDAIELGKVAHDGQRIEC